MKRILGAVDIGGTKIMTGLVEESDKASLEAEGDVDPKTRKAKMLPISFCIKARKL